MKKCTFLILLATVFLLGSLTACGELSSEETAAPPVLTEKVSPEVTQTPVPSVEPTDSVSPSKPEEPSSEPVESIQPEPVESEEPSPEPTPEPVDPADHVFPDLEAFFGLPLEEDRAHGVRGWRWQFEDMEPYDQLEAVEAELIALLLEPRWQLELVDKEVSVYESGDINPIAHYYFRYTGTAELTLIEDVIGVRLDHVNVVIYHSPMYGSYTIDIFRSPELEAVDPGSRISADVGAPEQEEGTEDDFWEKCSSCHGSGKCTHCSGKGEVRKFQAGLGWVEQDCTLCNRGKCRHCNGTGKD